MTTSITEYLTPIKFRSAEEFQTRENYLPQLRCEKEMLDRIVGHYEFAETEKLQCGLNGCNNWHWHGYVIRTKDGYETHCGRDCGNREFDVVFEEVETAYKDAVARKSRTDHLEQLGRDRNNLLAEAMKVLELLSAASNDAQRIVGEIRKDSALERAWDVCMRDGGRIMVEDEDSKRLRQDMGASADKADLVTIGIINGIAAVSEAPRTVHELRHQVITPLKDFDPTALHGMSLKELNARSATFGNLRLIINKGNQLLAEYAKFISTDNLQTIPRLQYMLPKKARTDRVDRILNRIQQQPGARHDVAQNQT